MKFPKFSISQRFALLLSPATVFLVFFFVPLLSILSNSCSQAPDSSDPRNSLTRAEDAPIDGATLEAAPRSAATNTAIVQQQSKLIYNGSLYFASSDFAQTRQYIDQNVADKEAYISSENFYLDKEKETQELTLRIPARNFFPFITDLSAKIGALESKRIDIADVTLKYIDEEKRLEIRKIAEQRLLELLQKAGNLADYLKIEERLSQLREDIASDEGRFRYLNNQIDYATLNLTYYRERPGKTLPQQRSHFGRRLAAAFSTGWHGILSSLVALVWLWPLWLLLAITWGIWQWRLQRQRKLESAIKKFVTTTEQTEKQTHDSQIE